MCFLYYFHAYYYKKRSFLFARAADRQAGKSNHDNVFLENIINKNIVFLGLVSAFLSFHL